MKNNLLKYGSMAAATGLVAASLAIVSPALAQTVNVTGTGSATVTTTSGQHAPGPVRVPGSMGGFGGRGGANGMQPGVFGTVSAISGTTLTVTSKAFGMRPMASSTPATTAAPVTKTYTVNAASATVTKAGAASTVGAIAVGDTVIVQGTVSGTTVTATKINDGIVPRTGGPGMGKLGSGTGTGTKPTAPASIITGNGEPVVAGSITAISGSSITITNKSNVTYTIDASAAKIDKGNATSSVASLATGDSVVVQGTVNGTAITASSVIDQGAASTTGPNGKPTSAKGGIFGAIGSFFSHLFGF